MPSNPAPLAVSEGTKARELAGQLARELDSLYGDKDSGLRAALYAWLGEYGYGSDDLGWQAVSSIVAGSDDSATDSTRDVRSAGVKLLAALRRAIISHENSGQSVDVVWEIAYVWVAAMRAAQADLANALTALEADAARLVSA
jgi:hypothetical protein